MGVSLLAGWLPLLVQVVAAALLVVAIGWRSHRWRILWLPLMVAFGIAVAIFLHWYVAFEGIANDDFEVMAEAPLPLALWIWIGLAGLAAGVFVVGWRTAQWWRRSASVLAVVLCLLTSALILNRWVGYFPTVQVAWDQLTGAPLPHEVDQATVSAMQRDRTIPPHGVVVRMDTGSAGSHFDHRGEFVYLPPAWFASNPPPKLPAVLMIGGVWGTPADWLQGGGASRTIDDFATAHHGNAPLFVFGDVSGSFHKDTECVNGPRGNAADHLTKDVVPYVVSHFGVSPDSTNWGAVGWSMGGTCAVNLTVMHPELFSTFVDVAGDEFPNVGDDVQTTERLFGGNADAYAAFNPRLVMINHGPYVGVSGWFSPPPYTDINDSDPHNGSTGIKKLQNAAHRLCARATKESISCAVVPITGSHTLVGAGRVLAMSLPWLAGQLGTPEVPRISLPEVSWFGDFAGTRFPRAGFR